MAPPVFAPFLVSAETWEAYEDRFECYLEAHDYTGLSSNRKRAHFLNACGPEVFATARALVAPLSIHDVPWDTLREKLKAHYAPTPSRIARRFKFRHRLQEEGEPLNLYIASLRTAALECEFQDLDDALLEQLVCGVRDLRLQRRLLAMKDLTLPMALDEARAAEMSERSTADIRRFQNSTSQSTGVHHEDDDPADTSDEETEVDRLKTSPPGKKRLQKKKVAACLSCGEFHPRASCRFRSAICRRCGKSGHIAKVCHSAGQPPDELKYRAPGKPPMGENRCDVAQGHGPTEVVFHQHSSADSKKLSLTVKLEGVACPMEIDTGSSRSIISWAILKRVVPSFLSCRLQPCPVRLRDYQGKTIPVMGQGRFHVETKNFKGSLPLIVVKGSLPTLLGLDWFSALGMGISGIHSVSGDSYDFLFTEFSSVFDGSLGRYTGSPISLNLDPQVAPIRLKPRRVPLALRPKVEAELDKLIRQGVLEPTDHSSWETPIVVPIKPDGSIRICADFKCTLNKALQAHPYPVPVVQHLLHSLGPGTVFAKLDLAQAYQQLPVDDASAEAQTIVTHRGAFKCRRLQFGISIAPGLFQNLMERLLQGLPGVVPYFDDVLVSAGGQAELVERVRAVLSRFKQAGLKLKRSKCVIGVPQVEFLGYLVDAKGIHPAPAKVAAIKSAPIPTSRTELQAFLGLLNFYSVFLPHKASVAEPLHRLLDKNTPWSWSPLETSAFQAVKELLTSSAVLVQYNADLPLVLTADASPFGIGAVLSHRFPCGLEAPLAFYSRTLSPAERNYSQLDREALALVASVKRFHDYVYGRRFELVTDHKPLLGLLSGDRQTPIILSPRLSRWTVFLAAYNYSLTYRPGKLIAHADALSRCPVPGQVHDPAPGSPVLLIEDWESPVTAVDIAAASAADPIFSQVLDWVGRGWPLNPAATAAATFRPFLARQHELSSQRGCLLWGHRVVVPPALQVPVLSRLHESHPGIVRMKGLARSYVWWPSLDKDIANWVSQCQACQMSRPAAPVAAPREWENPRAPWSRIHLDFAGPFKGRTFLIVVDAYSKWVEIALMASTTSEAVIQVLSKLFATHGLPDVLVTDNGPQLASATFLSYLASQGIRHAPIAPYHPASNGLAERAVRSAKEALARLDTGHWYERVSAYLLAQHTTPCPSTNRSPSELLMGRRLRTTLDRLHPGYSPRPPPDLLRPPRSFAEGDHVYVQNFGGEPRWLPGIISGITGPCSYRVRLEDGRTWRRHVDQLRGRPLAIPLRGEREHPMPAWCAFPSNSVPGSSPPHDAVSDNRPPDLPGGGTSPIVVAPPSGASAALQVQPPSIRVQPPSVPELRRSTRPRRPPAYLQDYACAIRGGRSVVFGEPPC